MDVAYVAGFERGLQVIKAAAGDVESFDLAVGAATPLTETFCARMVAGEIPHAVPDVPAHEVLRVLPVTERLRVGSYVGVPLALRDGSVYGSFGCLSHVTRPDIDERDVRILDLLAELLIGELETLRDLERSREQIQHVLDVGHIDIALQPIVHLATGRCAGMEALSRFGPGMGAPDEVFAAAHELGLGLELEGLALRSAFALLDSLRDNIYLGLNLAPSLACDLVDALPADADVPWHRIVLEVTEHAAIADYAELRRALQPLRERGLRVAVDDAGAGFASMQHVVEMRPDIIKVDRTLVDGLAGDPARRSVVSGFVLLGFELGATVLAEGVVTAEDLAAARRLGVTAAQGYVIARPSTDPADHRRWGGAHNLLADVGLADLG